MFSLVSECLFVLEKDNFFLVGKGDLDGEFFFDFVVVDAALDCSPVDTALLLEVMDDRFGFFLVDDEPVAACFRRLDVSSNSNDPSESASAISWNE